MTQTTVSGVAGSLGLAAMLVIASGCSTLLAVSGQQKLAAETAVLSGTVSADHKPSGPLIIGLIAHGNDGDFLLDHFVTEKPGPWIFAVGAGTYRVAAFEDANHDGRYDDEPALRMDQQPAIELAAGQRVGGVNLVIPKAGRFVREQFSLAELAPRSPEDQKRISLFARSVAGRVAALADPRFDPAVGQEGMWKYYDFILHAEPGIYFLEPYDPRRIPVLFVHGVGGTPRDFTHLIDSLDRRKYQAWVYYYPSGAKLETSASLLAQLFVRVREQYRFDKAAIVAHSMGGLISREFVLQDYENNATRAVRTWVTISSPFGGMASAGKGVERSPVVLECWRGLAPGSAYLDGLFYRDPATKKERRRLPEHVAWHMLFGFGASTSSDGVVTIASQLRPEAQEEARSLRGFGENHASILDSDSVAARLGEVLDEMR
ncbi:MAG TPA: alpha/beta fold hydrolase [Candidatus Limnocylindrales bacterium]|nr:alpha/beta fold hydrolase [Candidatus Limnocylindrales bacterium]